EANRFLNSSTISIATLSTPRPRVPAWAAGWPPQRLGPPIRASGPIGGRRRSPGTAPQALVMRIILITSAQLCTSGAQRSQGDEGLGPFGTLPAFDPRPKFRR